jgi:serine/threonine protein phosphatase 1
MEKILIVGDIHGCYTELQELLDRVGLSSDDKIIAVGDIVDRGPDSPRVLQFFRECPGAISLMGNHERKHVRSLRGEIEPALSQLITRWQFGEEIYPQAVAFMDTFPRFLELPEVILVHGFFEPGVPLVEQRENVLVGSLTGARYLSRRYGCQWYELYQNDKPIIVGHQDYSGKHEPFIYKDIVFGIDTECCRGGALTGLTLPDFKIFSVPSRKDYWAEVSASALVRSNERPRGH